MTNLANCSQRLVRKTVTCTLYLKPNVRIRGLVPRVLDQDQQRLERRERSDDLPAVGDVHDLLRPRLLGAVDLREDVAVLEREDREEGEPRRVEGRQPMFFQTFLF